MAFTFYERIIGPPNKLNTVALTAAMAENCADLITIEEMESAFNLDAAESNSLQQCINLFCGEPPTMTLAEMQGVFTLAESGIAYDTVTSLMTRLGVSI